nr:hypothetical protein [Tanacetum cinerariifolium]
GAMHRVQVQLVMAGLFFRMFRVDRTELGMQIQVALNVDNVFQADDCDAFNSDVDEAPIAQTMFMANLSSADLVYDEAGSSYDSDILSEVHNHDYYQDAVCEHHEVHEMHDDVQPNYVVDSHVDYTSDSNMILYDQYVQDNAVLVVQSNVSFVPNDSYMMILNDMHEQPAQHVSVATRNNVVDKSLAAELATYKEQVELYERRAKFELTKREQKIDEQLRIVITDCNIKEENLKKELHFVKMQITSTINHNKSMDLALNVDNVFQADDCDAFNFDVDEAPTAQTMFMANLSSADLVYDEACSSYDSDILSKVHNHDYYQDAVCEHHEVHEMHDDVQPN